MNKLLKKALKITLPLCLGGFVLYWIYRDFDFSEVKGVLIHGTNWWWMILSLIFGILSHIVRGVRWKQVLEPLGENPKTSDCINSIFVGYAANLVFPRIGEVSRCGILLKYDNISFAKSLGTVVTERLIDSVCIVLITAITFLLQMPIFIDFFQETGTKLHSLGHLFTSIWFYIILLCTIGVIIILIQLFRIFSISSRIKGVLNHLWEGIISLRGVKNKPLFTLYTIALWLCYFLHFYFTFYCFGFTEHLGILAALVMFVGGTFAVIVPTPNGAGPWHFAIITMMMLYGVNNIDAGIFALIVHGIQTFLVVLLGIYGWAALLLTNRKLK